MSAEHLEALPPIRVSDLVKLGNCRVCGGKQLAGQMPLFYRFTVERCGFDSAAVRRAAGFEMAMGPLASVMGDDRPIARVIDGPTTVFVHEECAGNIGHLLSLFPEDRA